ncbi:hypothetical protein DDE18_12275 [Nocardioides gansuensis]|uniref:Peptidase M15C domain-containing protein n=1 Tax=Nocardioides gansuensis TaxID=2138300 RepID=A0A2T8F9C4_9ACTN|nr:M15 family metallopeptidase [Nocardioides gansuensis]PVG82267.1 hypothetical protein DDE18_12275 [Nocardioides gansuensis]
MSGVRRARRAAVAALALLATASCGGGEQPKAGDDEPSPAASSGTLTKSPAPSESSSTEVPVADPEHAVEPPGPRKERLWSADLLVYSQEPLEDGMVEAIRSITGVQRTESLSLAAASIENRVITVGAVDPATYRLFAPQASADLLEAWQRVAGGELAIDLEVGKKLVDEQGFLKLGNDKDAPEVHIGAFAPQVPRIDAVINEKWGQDLGMPQGNALLISTDFISPQSVTRPIQKIVGNAASVQILGPDLDVGAVQTAVLTGGSVADAVGTFRYTVLGGGRIAPESSWVEANIRTEQVPIIGSMTCHKVMFPQLRAALLEIQQRGLADKIHPGEYAGCYYPRYIANTQRLSLHSFGIAFDINVPGNQRGTVGEIDRDVVAIFKRWGFGWGGDWSWTDPMHFEMNQLVDPQ